MAGWVEWTGHPDDDDAHRLILAWLQPVAGPKFLNPRASLSNPIKGNLREFITYEIGRRYEFSDDAIAHTANAWDPISHISRPDIDIVWLYFGDSEAEDWAAIQEVKTTGSDSVQLADELISDYDKLFGDNVQYTLQTRLGALKNKLDQQGLAHLCHRTTALTGPAPQLSPGIRLLPTLVHDSGLDSSSKMTAVRQVLIRKGWSPGSVECWSITIGHLNHRLTQLARGQL